MVPEEYRERLEKLVDVFLVENQKLNLSALRTREKCWAGNVLDSVAGVGVKNNSPHTQAQEWGLPAGQAGLGGEENTNSKLLDIGTGGGFPLLPLALCMPQLQCTGIDSTTKKLDAIGRMFDTLDLENIALITGRCEQLAQDKEHREQYDIVTARAVAALPTLLEYAAGFLQVGGQLIAWKSLDIDQELRESEAAQQKLNLELIDTHRYTLPDGWGKRQLLIFQKTALLDQQYPRAVGIPKKMPIL